MYDDEVSCNVAVAADMMTSSTLMKIGAVVVEFSCIHSDELVSFDEIESEYNKYYNIFIKKTTDAEDVLSANTGS